MASDRQQFKRASEYWECLQNERLFSVSPEVGYTAVIVASKFDREFLKQEECDADDIEYYLREHERFQHEAFDIQRQLEADGAKAVVLEPASFQAFNDAIADKSISSIITIGHGDISGIEIEDDEGGRFIYDWRDSLYSLDHLKLGYFIQRHCGMTNRDMPVPLGLFCMADHRNVIAPIARIFDPKSLEDDKANRLLVRVSNVPQMDYAMVKALAPDM